MSTAFASTAVPPVAQRVSSYWIWLSSVALLLTLHGTNQTNSDEGIVLSGAWHLLNGRSLYTDLFEFVAPGSYYLVFAAWKLFGAHLWLAKLMGIIAIAGAAAGIYCTSLLISAREQPTAPRWALLFGPLLYCLMSGYWPTINHNTFNLVFIVWAAFFLTRSILLRSRSDASLGGLITGIAVVFLQHRGLALAAAAIVAFACFSWRDKDTAWLRTAAGFLVAMLLPLGLTLLLWPASLLVDSLIVFPATRYLEVNRTDHLVFLIATSSVVLAIWLLRNCQVRGVWFLIALQGVLLLAALQRPDPSHVTVGLFPVLSLFPLLVATSRNASWIPNFFLWWISVSLFALLAPLAVHLALTYPLRFAGKGDRSPVIAFIRKNCASSPYIYAGPFESWVYFAARKLNPTRYSVLLTDLHTEAQFAEARKDIETHRPECVLTNYAMVEKFNYNRNNAVDRYIAAHYKLAYQNGLTQVLIARTP